MAGSRLKIITQKCAARLEMNGDGFRMDWLEAYWVDLQWTWVELREIDAGNDMSLNGHVDWRLTREGERERETGWSGSWLSLGRKGVPEALLLKPDKQWEIGWKTRAKDCIIVCVQGCGSVWAAVAGNYSPPAVSSYQSPAISNTQNNDPDG